MESKDWSSSGYFNPNPNPRSKSASGFVLPRSKPARGYVPHGPNPLADLDPPTKLCENIILDVLVEIDILSVTVRT